MLAEKNLMRKGAQKLFFSEENQLSGIVVLLAFFITLKLRGEVSDII